MPHQPTRVSPILVEREDELRAIDAVIGQVADGVCRMLMLVGEAGVGKSRLAYTAAGRAEARGFDVLRGACTERDLAFPFAPFVDALRQAIVTSHDPGAVLGPQAYEVRELLPEHDPEDNPPHVTTSVSPEIRKRRCFEGLVALLGRKARTQPQVLLLEDLHWCDPTSLELLELLPRRLGDVPLLVLGTYRENELPPTARRSINAMHRARTLTVLSVPALSPAGVRTMLRAMLLAPPSSGLVSTLHTRTGGIPFLVEELVPLENLHEVRHVDRLSVPETVRDVVLGRVEELDSATQHVAKIAAVIGERVPFATLLEVSGLTREDLLGQAHRLIDRGILVEDSASNRAGFRFRHALTRDALLDRLLLLEVRELHGQVARVIEAGAGNTPPPEVLGELGYHFHVAGEWKKALLFARRAGDAAQSLHAHAEATSHFQRALDAAIRLDHPDRTLLHCRLGQALSILGELDQAKLELDAALVHAEASDNIEIMQETVYTLAGLYASMDYATSHAYAERAVSIARECNDPIREARALNRLGNVMTNVLRFAEGRALYESALHIAQREGDRWGAADALDHIGMSHYLLGEIVQARPAFGQAADIFREVGDRERAASALTNRGLYLVVLDGASPIDATPATLRLEAAHGLRISHEIGWRAGEAYAYAALATCEMGEGRYATADATAQTALALAREIGHRQWTLIALFTLGLLHAQTLDDDVALDHVLQAHEIAREIGSRQWLERTDAWIERLQDRLGPESHLIPELSTRPVMPSTVGQRRILLNHVERELRSGRYTSACSLIDMLNREPEALEAAEVLLLKAEALAGLGRQEASDMNYLRSRRLASTVGPASLLWRVAAGRSRLWRGVDDTLAASEGHATLRLIDEMAASIQSETWRAAFLQSSEVQAWKVSTGRQRTRITSAPGGLTPRELEIAARVAQGMTNKEIAHTLSISAKTVEMHVGGCLSKLGFSSRSRLSAWAVEHGLATFSEYRDDAGSGP